MAGVSLILKLCSPKRAFTCLLCGILLLICYYIMWVMSHGKGWLTAPSICSHSDLQLEENMDLARDVNKLLGSHNIQHFLCYGSLWGALKFNNPLPWDGDVEFCVLNDDLDNIEEATLYRLFRSEGMTLSYSVTTGIYHVTRRLGKVDLVLFSLSEDYVFLQRIGISNLMISDDGTKEKFPSALAAPPLPEIKFGDSMFPVPREGKTIQKYFHQDVQEGQNEPKGC